MKSIISLVVCFSVLNSYSQLKFEFIYPVKDIFIEKPKLNKLDTFYQDSFMIVFFIEDIKGKSQVEIFKHNSKNYSLNYENGEHLLIDVMRYINPFTGLDHFRYYEYYYPMLSGYIINGGKKVKENLEPSEYIKFYPSSAEMQQRK